MEITYRIDDGYTGDRPQRVIVADSEIAACANQQEAEQMIEEAVDNHFRNFILPWFKMDGYRAQIAKLLTSDPVSVAKAVMEAKAIL